MLFASRTTATAATTSSVGYKSSSFSVSKEKKEQEWMNHKKKCFRQQNEINVFTSVAPLYIACILLSKLFQQQQYTTTTTIWWSNAYNTISSHLPSIFFFQEGNSGTTNTTNNSNSSTISIVTGFQRDFYITLFVSILMASIRILLSSFSHHTTKNNRRKGTFWPMDDTNNDPHMKSKNYKKKKKNYVQAIVKEGTSQHMLRTNEILKFQSTPKDDAMVHVTTNSSSTRRSNTTVMFRLLYTMVSSVAAIWFFRSCDFWSKFVGGTNGQTIHCWDLKGGILLDKMIDLDFDQSHSKLRYFFILEISYHLQNFTFRTLSLLTTTNNNNNTNNKSSIVAPILEDTLQIIALVVSFLFSSSRRLGAIGIFALNVSSIALNLLHICINHTATLTPSMIIALYRYFVVPIFLYCRLFIMPFVVWHSIAFESKTWLIQLEHGFHSNGLSIALYIFANFVMFITISLQLVYARRLIYHPYIQKLKKYQQQQQQPIITKR